MSSPTIAISGGGYASKGTRARRAKMKETTGNSPPARAAVVARILYAEGHIPPYNIAVSGRAGQNPIDKAHPDNPANERVEILLEYAQHAAVAY